MGYSVQAYNCTMFGFVIFTEPTKYIKKSKQSKSEIKEIKAKFGQIDAKIFNKKTKSNLEDQRARLCRYRSQKSHQRERACR